MPSLTQWLWLVMLLILLAQPWRTMMVASDGDTCMHWRVGEWMLEHHEIIQTDFFSHTRLGEPFISKEWLSEIIFAAAGRWAGLYGLAVVAALVIATTFAFLHRQLLRETGNHMAAVFVALVAAWAACTHWLARPHVFSFLLAVLWINELRHFERRSSALRLFVTLSALTLLWVNLHGGYLAGFIVLGTYWCGTLIELALTQTDRSQVAALRREFNVFTGAGILCGVVSLINPSGYKLHFHNLQFLRSGYLTNWLAEYRSPDFHATHSYGFLAWLALLFLTLVYCRPKLSATSALVLISWTYFALYAARNIPLMTIFIAPIMAKSLSEAKWPRFDRVEQALRLPRGGRGWPMVVAAAVIAIACVQRPTEMPGDHWPTTAVEFIKQHPEQFAGNMFNQYVWGGYLMQFLPEQRVFVDGRTDFYGTDLIKEFDMTARLGTNWTAALDKYKVAWTLMPSDHRLNCALALSPAWRCMYSNKVATIYSRNL
jgi:hypothetical protein